MKIQHTVKAGYTIVEVMIFLAVSSALLISAMLVISGQQQRQEFTQAVREADSKIQDVVNDFATGLYPNRNDFNCTTNANPNSPPAVTVGSAQQGTRLGCAFIGKVIQFAPGTNPEAYRVITVVGRQFEGDTFSELVENIVESRPRALAGSATVNGVDLSEDGQFGYGLRIGRMTYTNAGGLEQPIGAIGFFSSFANNSAGSAMSGKQTTQLVVIPGTALGQSQAAASSSIDAIATNNWGTFEPAFVSRPVTICLLSGGTDQHGIIRLGDNDRQIATTVTIGGGPCP